MQMNVWVLRAIAAMEVDYPGEGWLAGRRLKELGAEESDDAKIRRVIAQLDRKGWLGKERTWREWSKWKTEEVKQAAVEGDSESQNALGYWYDRGQSGLPKDKVEAWTSLIKMPDELVAITTSGRAASSIRR